MTEEELDRKTPEQTRTFSRRLLWEFRAITAVTNALVPHAGRDDEEDLAVRTALIESFLMRSRAFIAFLYDGNKGRVRPDDAFASDFFEPGIWSAVCPDQPKALKISTLFGWQIAHFSYKGPHQMAVPREWDFGTIWLCLAAILAVFVQQVPDDRVEPGFREAARELLPAWVLAETRDTIFQLLGQLNPTDSPPDGKAS